MLYIIALALAVAWLLGYSAFHVTSSLLHLLLVAAAILLVMQLLTNRRAV